jgi:hypothetical protein
LHKIQNQSTLEDWKVFQWFDPRFYGEFLVEATVLPDVCPAGLIPNGTKAVAKKTWLDVYQFREIIGDIGCAMSIAKAEGFSNTELRKVWNQLYASLKETGKTVLGSGNHFIDACTNARGELFIIVHVGSRMTSEEKSAFRFERDYARCLKRAEDNHAEIWSHAAAAFGRIGPVRNFRHDAAEITGDLMILHKGVLRAPAGSDVLIASSFDDAILIGKTRPEISKWSDSVSHGTGRIASRGEAKSLPVATETIKARLIIPDDLPDSRWRQEAPVHYRPLSAILPKLEEVVEIGDRLIPAAFMGGF